MITRFRFRNLKTTNTAFITSFHHKIAPPSLNLTRSDSSSFLIPNHPAYKIARRWHLGHSHGDHENEHLLLQKEGENIFRLGLAADIGLATGKAFVGYLSGSTAIIADAAHSVSDVVLSGVSLWSFKAAKAPKDNEHPYGHGKFETLGALGISCMLLATSGGIAWHALDILLGLYSSGPEMASQLLAHEHVHSQHHGGHHHGMDMDHPILALNMTILSIGVKEGLYWATKRVGERQGSGLMKANAWHHRADAISSVVALIGVGGSILGVKFLDPLAGLLVSGMILKAGAETGYQSIMELVDAAIPSQQLDPIKKTILQVEGVKGCHRLRGRRAGSTLYLDVHIEVDLFSSVSAAHDIGENVRHHIHKSHPAVSEIFIHIDPAYRHEWMDDMDHNRIIPTKNNHIDNIVSDIVSSNFVEMSVQRVTQHALQGRIILQIEVSMPHDMQIRNAMEIAEEAEKEILKAVSDVTHVSIQLQLGRPIPQLNHS